MKANESYRNHCYAGSKYLRLAFLVLLLLLSASVGSAGPCPTATVADLLSLTPTCTLGNLELTFTGFSGDFPAASVIFTPSSGGFSLGATFQATGAGVSRSTTLSFSLRAPTTLVAGLLVSTGPGSFTAGGSGSASLSLIPGGTATANAGGGASSQAITFPASTNSATGTAGVTVSASGVGESALLNFANFNFILRSNAPFLIRTLAGTGIAGFGGDNGPPSQAILNQPFGVATDGRGNVFIADSGNNRVRKISATAITTIAGTGLAGFGGDSGAAINAGLSMPMAVAVDQSGNLYIADSSNHRIRKIDGLGIITTIAGNGVPGFAGDNGRAVNASLMYPTGVAADQVGNVFISDTYNNRIRRVAVDGTITTVVGNGVYGFDPTVTIATQTPLASPTGVAVDRSGNLLIADNGNNLIRMVSGGIIRTIAGTGVGGYNGDTQPATSAQLLSPFGVAVDPSGRVLVADEGNSRVRLISGGVITTLAGISTPGFSGDGGLAASASLSYPTGIALDSFGQVFIADLQNQRIRLAQINSPAIIRQENAKTGTTAWVLANPAQNGEISGYASLTSVNRGQSIKFFVKTSDPSYTMEFFRLGWYGGTGARSMGAPVTRLGTPQPACLAGDVGLLECNWTDPYVLTVPNNLTDLTDWASGVYLAKLTSNPSQLQSYIVFVVRDDARFSDVLFQSSVITYQAYNAWGGKSLYRSNSSGGIPARKVSLNRPYDDGDGSGQVLFWEYNAIRFLEREGYDVTYATDIDVHVDASLLLRHRAFLSMGHDEYWSWEMRNAVEAARDGGVNLGFFGANACFWQVRLEPAVSDGAPNRTVVAYKDMAFSMDPIAYWLGGDPSQYYLLTTHWRDWPVSRPEEAMIGAAYDYSPINADIVVEDTTLWPFVNTGLRPGDHLPGLLGYEVDRIFGLGPPNTIRLAHSPYVGSDGLTRFSDMTMYKAPSGAIVFATGSMQWNWGLDAYGHTPVSNPAAQQITRNVLAAFGAVPQR